MSVTTENPTSWEIAYADMAVYSALDVIGRKLTRSLPRNERHASRGVRHTDTWHRHTLVAISDDQVPNLVDGAFRFLDKTLPGENSCLRRAVEHHVRAIVATNVPHDVRELASTIRAAGCLDT